MAGIACRFFRKIRISETPASVNNTPLNAELNNESPQDFLHGFGDAVHIAGIDIQMCYGT